MKKTLRIYDKFQKTAIALAISSTSIVVNANTSVAPPLPPQNPLRQSLTIQPIPLVSALLETS